VSAWAGPLLLMGGHGMLGRAWRGLLDAKGIEYVAPSKEELDLTKPADLDRFLTARCCTVVNCAGWTDVDGAETQTEEAQRINGEAVGVLAQRCAAMGALLVHYSTDYVFDGQSSEPYRVDQPAHPVNAYGCTKLVGDRLVEQSGGRYLLIRTSWLYAPWGKNFVRTIADLAARRESLRVVDDQWGRPTSAEHLAGVSLELIERGFTGVYHVTDGGECSWYDFAVAIARHVNPGCCVEPCATGAFPRLAKRPAYSVLDLSGVEAVLGAMPDWETNLAGVMARISQEGMGAES